MDIQIRYLFNVIIILVYFGKQTNDTLFSHNEETYQF